MQLKIKVLKFTKPLLMNYVVIVAILSTNFIYSQNNNTTTESSRNKIDGVAAVVGDFLVLDSDIDKQFNQLKASGISTDDMTTCQVFGKLLEDKLASTMLSENIEPGSLVLVDVNEKKELNIVVDHSSIPLRELESVTT